MPWQRLAADVALELDTSGKFRYHTVMISVPRQSGKSTLGMQVGLHRTLVTPGGRVWWTAQTGQAARERWIKEAATPAEDVLGGIVAVKRGAGDTRLVAPHDGQFRPMPPTADYLHGEQSDLVMIDEPWAHTEAEGAALMQAVVPTMATRSNSQTWFMSTMGTAASTWWHSMLTEAIESSKPGICVIDYGIGPDVDPTDLEAVIAAHPAVGHTIGTKAIYDAADTLTPAEFARGYGNVATSHVGSAIIDDATLDTIETDQPLDTGAIAVGVAVSWTTSLTAITVAGHIGGTPALEVITARPGISWVPDMLARLIAAHRPVSVRIDPVGPSARLTELLTSDPRLEHHITKATGDDLVVSTEHLLDAVGQDTPGILIRRDPDLRQEIAGAALRTIGDKGRLISRKQSIGSTARLEAGLLALRGLTEHHRQTPAPMIWSP